MRSCKKAHGSFRNWSQHDIDLAITMLQMLHGMGSYGYQTTTHFSFSPPPDLRDESDFRDTAIWIFATLAWLFSSFPTPSYGFSRHLKFLICNLPGHSFWVMSLLKYPPGGHGISLHWFCWLTLVFRTTVMVPKTKCARPWHMDVTSRTATQTGIQKARRKSQLWYSRICHGPRRPSSSSVRHSSFTVPPLSSFGYYAQYGATSTSTASVWSSTSQTRRPDPTATPRLQPDSPTRRICYHTVYGRRSAGCLIN